MAKEEFEEWKEGEEYVPLYIPEKFRNIEARLEQWTTRDLWSKILTGEIDYEPGFQRHYVWDDVKASKFIESLFLNIPVPPIFLAEERDGKWVVVDGHQRLETIVRFLQPLLTTTKEGRDTYTKVVHPTKVDRKGGRKYIALVLKKLEILEELNHKKATDIEQGRMKSFWERKIPVVAISRTVHPDLKFEIFIRLNQGAMTLNRQEIRNCLYRGPYNDLIKKLAENPKFLELWGKREPDKRMKDRERVLAFFAFAHHPLEEYKGPWYRFLNKEMEVNTDATKETLEEYEKEFWSSIEWAKRVFKDNTFRLFEAGTEEKPQGKWGGRRDTIYEVEMVGFSKWGDKLEEIVSNLRKAEQENFFLGLRHKLVGVMTAPSFRETLIEGTKNPYNVQRRFEMWSEAIEKSINRWKEVVDKAKRIIELQRKSTACWRCSEHILSFEDGEILKENGEYHLVHRCHKIALEEEEIESPEEYGF